MSTVISSPMIFCVSNRDNYYIYDAATSQVLHVAPYIYDNIENLFAMTEQEVSNLPENYQDRELFISSWRKLHQQRKRFRYMPFELPDIGFEISKNKIKSMIKSQCANIVLEMTHRCNLRCKYCVYSGNYEHTRTHGYGSMNTETAKKSIDFIRKCSESLQEGDHIGIGFTGGEPMLNWNVLQWTVKYASSLDWSPCSVHFHMTTNATLMTKERIEFLIEHGVSLLISLDGPREVHDRCRLHIGEVRGSFDEVLHAIDLIRSISPKYLNTNVRFSAVLSYPIDWLTLDRFFRVEMGLTAGKLQLAWVREGNSEYFSDKKVKQREQKGYSELEQRFLIAAERGVLFGKFAHGSPEKRIQMEGKTCITFPYILAPLMRFHRRYISSKGWPDNSLRHSGCCIPPTRRMLVDTKGAIYPCDRIDYNGFTQIGDLEHGVDVDKVIHMLRDFHDMTKVECGKCWAIRLCEQCLVTSVGGDSFIRKDKLSYCDAIRRSLKNRLQMYCDIISTNPNALDDNGEVLIM